MATGTGKTVVFSQLPDRVRDLLPGQMLILAHREELIDQAVAKMREINPRLRIDKEKAEHHADPSVADAIVASVQTLGRKGTKRLLKYNWDRIDKYVTDEAHHAVAQSYLNIYDAANLFSDRNKRLLLGVTATPQRGDGQGLAKVFDKIVYTYSMRQAIEDGWLVDVRGIRVNSDTVLDDIHVVAGDFAQDELADAVNNPERNQLCVKAWLDNAEWRQTVGFTVNIQHAKNLAEMFRYYKVAAEAVWGDDPQRREKLLAHKNCEFPVLLNCAVLTEGYDDWQIGCVLLAKPTKSGATYVQMVGRGTRLQPGVGNLKQALAGEYRGYKQDCLVIDVVDASSRHSLVTLPTLMGMNGKLNLKGKSLVGTIQQLEQTQEQHPSLDFSNLTDLLQLRALIQDANLFDFKPPVEAERNSALTWHSGLNGGFVLLLPGNEDKVKIAQNLLDQWEITANIAGKKYRGQRDRMEEAFSAADKLVYDTTPEAEKLLHRQAKWRDDPPTDKQMTFLRKIFKGKPIPRDLTKGLASELIGRHLAQEGK